MGDTAQQSSEPADGDSASRPQMKLSAIQTRLVEAAGGEEKLKQKLLSGSFTVDAGWLAKQFVLFHCQVIEAMVTALSSSAKGAATAAEVTHEATATEEAVEATATDASPSYFTLKEVNPVLQVKFAPAGPDGLVAASGSYSFKDFGIGSETKATVLAIPAGAVTNDLLKTFFPFKIALGFKFQSKLFDAFQAYWKAKGDTAKAASGGESHEAEGGEEEEEHSICEIGFTSAISCFNDKVQLSAEASAIALNYKVGSGGSDGSGWSFRKTPGEITIGGQFADIPITTIKIGKTDVNVTVCEGVEFVIAPNWPRILESLASWVEDYIGGALDLGGLEAGVILVGFSVCAYGAWETLQQQNVTNEIDKWTGDVRLFETAQIVINGVTSGLTSNSNTTKGGTAYVAGFNIGVAQRGRVTFDRIGAQQEGSFDHDKFQAWVDEVRKLFTTTTDTEEGCKLVRYLTFDRWFQYSRDAFDKPKEDLAVQAWKAITLGDPYRLTQAEQAFYRKSTGYVPMGN